MRVLSPAIAPASARPRTHGGTQLRSLAAVKHRDSLGKRTSVRTRRTETAMRATRRAMATRALVLAEDQRNRAPLLLPLLLRPRRAQRVRLSEAELRPTKLGARAQSAESSQVAKCSAAQTSKTSRAMMKAAAKPATLPAIPSPLRPAAARARARARARRIATTKSSQRRIGESCQTATSTVRITCCVLPSESLSCS